MDANQRKISEEDVLASISSDEGEEDVSSSTEDLGSSLAFIEEDSESEPEFECDNWDDSKVVTNQHEDKSIVGYHLMPTCSPNPEEIPSKKQKLCPEIRTTLLDKNFIKTFKSSWKNGEKCTDSNTELIIEPFKVCVIKDFLENAKLLNDIRQEFNEIDWNMRQMDLYEFFQSRDLKHFTSDSAIGSIYELLHKQVMPLLSGLTAFELTHISATCSVYTNTDYLLVHDDQQDDRMIAFVLYLTDPDGWDETKGGALQLLTKEPNGQPSVVSRSIYPENNQFVFFPVTNDSFHQVDEVTSLSHCRFSINGWFHTKVPPIFQTVTYDSPSTGLFSGIGIEARDFDVDLKSWLNDDYFGCDTSKEIQEYFAENSEICLKKFLKTDCFDNITQILASDCVKWKRIGPPNRYNYETLDDSGDVPFVLDRLLGLFQSKKMFGLLGRLTGLELVKKGAMVRTELQRWTPGCYTLLSDYDWQAKKELDLILHFGCKARDVIGARTEYVTIDDQIQDALITIDPEENDLNIIYRDTARFTKYFSKQSRCCCFYTLICSYTE